MINTVDLKSLLEERRRDKIDYDDKTEGEQLLRVIKELDNYVSASSVSASSVHPSGETDEILVGLSEGEHQRVQINSTNWSRIQRWTK